MKKLQFLHFLKWRLTGKFSKFCFERIHCDTDRDVVFKFREIWLIGLVQQLFTLYNINHTTGQLCIGQEIFKTTVTGWRAWLWLARRRAHMTWLASKAVRRAVTTWTACRTTTGPPQQSLVRMPTTQRVLVRNLLSILGMRYRSGDFGRGGV